MEWAGAGAAQGAQGSQHSVPSVLSDPGQVQEAVEALQRAMLLAAHELQPTQVCVVCALLVWCLECGQARAR